MPLAQAANTDIFNSVRAAGNVASGSLTDGRAIDAQNTGWVRHGSPVHVSGQPSAIQVPAKERSREHQMNAVEPFTNYPGITTIGVSHPSTTAVCKIAQAQPASTSR